MFFIRILLILLLIVLLYQRLQDQLQMKLFFDLSLARHLRDILTSILQNLRAEFDLHVHKNSSTTKFKLVLQLQVAKLVHKNELIQNELNKFVSPISFQTS